jgi:formylglycine-generating enzyme
MTTFSRAVFLSLLLLTFAVVARADVLNMPAGQVSLQTVPVGNPHNAGSFKVDYNYSIGKYDVTVAQYTAFLNAVAADDPFGLYHPTLPTDTGITRSGSSGSYTYSVVDGLANHPATVISWGDAARFANWLSNGQPTGPEGSGTTETGAYTLNGANTDQTLIAVRRNANASWAIPTENEWCKAAYYNPATGTNYLYPLSSSDVPTAAPPGNTPNTGNFHSVNGYVTTGSTDYDTTKNYTTDVGAYTASASPYGAYDMGGNVFNWNSTNNGQADYGWRGASFLYAADNASAALSIRRSFGADATEEKTFVGFRLVHLFLPGDVNSDGHVNANDISAMMQALTNEASYSQTSGISTSDLEMLGDVNVDGQFTIADLQKLQNVLKAGGGSADPVPEPSAAVLAGLGLMGMILCAKRNAKVM